MSESSSVTAGTEPTATAAHIVVQRTARFLLVGEPSPEVREVWIALHGYGQLAADFARAMAPVASAERLLVVPEALSRFYLESPVRGTHMTARVGATWMTREDREAEIADHVAYLDALLERVLLSCAPGSPTTRVLGFSQGVATAARWLTRGTARTEHLILWAGQLPDDVEASQLVDQTRRTRLSYVWGRRDDLLTSASITRTVERLSATGAPFDELTFDGGHRLDRATLLDLAQA
ncbi:MAG TPA: hypothetical protein VEA99_21500 [Gemmatimonadaceae bacterium]|nr:hypothetical protein [Gemmatimonadaceae bacterium]